MTAAIAEPDFGDLPRVTGMHRDRVLASRRRVWAVQLVSAGLSYQQVADALGYANKGTVFHLVQAALRSTQAASVEDHREQAYQRLESLLEALWDRAQSGDLQAAKTALRVVVAELRLGPARRPRRAARTARAARPHAVLMPDNSQWRGMAIAWRGRGVYCEWRTGVGMRHLEFVLGENVRRV